jgi:hypothetical protein
VAERRGAGGVGGDDAAGKCPGEGRRRRKPGVRACERFLHRGDRHPGLDANESWSDLEDAVQLLGRKNHFPHRRRSAGERRLRAHGQQRPGRADDGGHVGNRTGHGDRRGVAAREVRGVGQILGIQDRTCRRL